MLCTSLRPQLRPTAGCLLGYSLNRLAFHEGFPVNYQRQQDHTPNTQHNETVYVLALHTDRQHHDKMTALRDRFFPPQLNKLTAHVALFRALPGSKLDGIVKDLIALTSTTFTFPIKTSETFRLSKGVAINIDDVGESRAIYDHLQRGWKNFLSKQDQSYRPHYTVANKLNKEVDVQSCLEAVRSEFQSSEGMVNGLALYKYDRGWWVDEQVFWLQQHNASP